MKVGIKAKQPNTNKLMKDWGLAPILSIYFNVRPVWIKIKLFGIRPKIIK